MIQTQILALEQAGGKALSSLSQNPCSPPWKRAMLYQGADFLISEFISTIIFSPSFTICPFECEFTDPFQDIHRFWSGINARKKTFHQPGGLFCSLPSPVPTNMFLPDLCFSEAGVFLTHGCNTAKDFLREFGHVLFKESTSKAGSTVVYCRKDQSLHLVVWFLEYSYSNNRFNMIGDAQLSSKTESSLQCKWLF